MQYFLVEDKTPLLWSTQFMRDIAEQNFQQYYQSMSDDLKSRLKSMRITAPKGKLVLVNDSELQTITIARVYETLKKPEATLERDYRTRITWSAPTIETGNVIVSIATAVWNEKDFVGIVGQDINLNIIVDWMKYADLANMPDSLSNRVILCDYDG